MFQHNFGISAVIDVELTIELLLQCCHFVTDITAVKFREFWNMYTQYTLKITNCYFTFNSSNLAAKIIGTKGKITLDWLLWGTTFQTNNYHMLSSHKNFMNFIGFIADEHISLVSISETPYASGNNMFQIY